MAKTVHLFLFLLVAPLFLIGQTKQDYNWIVGYDPSLLDSIGQIIKIDFSEAPPIISLSESSYNFWMEGSNTSMSDQEGNLLFYSNGCKIINAKGELMANGDSINPGLIEFDYCPDGGSPIVQGVIALPAPKRDSLYYVFTLDMDFPYLQTAFLGIAPQRLFCQTIDISKNGGLGEVIKKNEVAIFDTLGRSGIQAAQHANGKDWWLIVPKCQSNCYFLMLIDSTGFHPPEKKCLGHIWNDNDIPSQSVFTPDLKKYIRMNYKNGLNIFDFDNLTGELSNPVQILGSSWIHVGKTTAPCG